MARTRNNILVRAICIYEFFKTSIDLGRTQLKLCWFEHVLIAEEDIPIVGLS